MREPVFPFSALVGQPEIKLALLLHAVDPHIGGLLIRGQKGTAKSTAVRALAAILPPLPAVRDCPYHCDPTDPRSLCDNCLAALRAGELLPAEFRPVPLVTLPLSADEEMLVGGLDLEAALTGGWRHFQPGLLARANRGLLYVDEVNLLDDHLVDLLLGAAAAGENRVERDGVSVRHPADFVLLGTMNPEEGELRPHLLDRFGLCVQVVGEQDPERRVAVMERREAFDRDPAAFAARFYESDARLTTQIVAARDRLPAVRWPAPLQRAVSELCLHQQVAGHRADLVIRRAAAALVAFEGRDEVCLADLHRVAPLALRHRRRRPLPPNPPAHEDAAELDSPAESGAGERPEPADGDQRRPAADPDRPASQPGAEVAALVSSKLFAVGDPFPVRPIEPDRDRWVRPARGRRWRSRTLRQGHTIKAVRGRTWADIAVGATLRAAAPQQRYRTPPAGLAIAVRDSDLHTRIRQGHSGTLLLFIVDASNSMGVQSRMQAVKGAILSLLLDAYQKRDVVALVSFRERGAVVNLAPTASVELALRHLEALPTGGHTPLAHGLVLGQQLLQQYLRRRPESRPIVIVITDGKANVPLNPDRLAHQELLVIAGRMADEKRARYIVVDTEAGNMYFGLAAELARRLGAEHVAIADLQAQDLVRIAKHSARLVDQ